MADKPSGLKAPAKIGKPALTKQSGLKAPSNVAVKATVDASRKNDTENFIIGDKVLVSGTKVGKIQYLGECEFAPGQWAGVVLENPVGKNDGSVGGVKYFQCEPLHGVFARPNKLERATNTSSELATKAKSAKNSRPSALTVANVKASTAVTPAKSKQSGLRSPTSSIRSLKLGGVSRTGAAAKPADIKVNDRVVVGESKIGTARYVGETDFAKGCWVGIELDEMLGKNDGSVAGKRYFSCAVNFGLFSLIQKVQKVGFPTTTPGRVKTTTTAAKKRPVATGTAVKSPGSSSAVSVSSLSSISSLKGPSKLRTEVSSRYKQKTAASGVQALQEALLEKQQHVESLLAERDMERNQLMEVNLTAAEKLSELRKMQEVHETFSAEKESQLDALRALVEQADQDKVRISQELEEEKRKNEDLQFRLEEGEICKEDLEADLIHFKEKCQDLEAGLSIERNKSLHLQTSLQETRALSVDDKSDLNTLRSERASFEQQLMNLKEQLSVAQDATNESGAEDPRIFELEEQVVEAKALMEEQEDALSKLRQQVQNLEKDKEQLLDQVQDIVSSNTTNTEFLQSEINEYKDQLLTFQQQCNSLKTEKENMKTEFDQVLLSSGDQNSQVKTLTDAISAKDEKIHSLEESFSNANSEIKTLEKTSENLKSDLLKYKEEILLLNSKLNLSEEAFKRAEENCTASSKTIEELNQRLQKADSTINASELCKKEMEIKLELLQKQAENVNANYKEASNNLLQLQDDFKKFKDESDATKETLTANFLELKNKKQELEKSHQNDENQIVRLSEQLAHLQKTNNESRETIEKMSQQKGEQTQHLVLQLQESQSSLAKLESARIAQQEKFAVLMQEKEALKKELQKAEENIKGILEEKSNLEDKANITNKDMAEFQQLNEELHKQIQTSSEEKKKLEESVKLISAEIKVTAQQSTEEVARFQLVISDLENNNTHLSEKVTASNEKIQAMQVQIRELTEDNRTLRLQITTSTEDLSYRNKEIESLMQDSDKKEQQLSELQIYIEKKENTILELQREVQLLTELKDEMQTALDGKNVEIREFSKNLAAEQVRMTNFKLELNGCKEDAANKNKLIQNLEEDLVLLREKSDASSKAEQKSLFDANTCLKELQDKLEESTTKLAATEELLCTLQNEKVDLNDKLSTLLLESKDKSEKLELLNKSNSDLAELNSTYQQHLNSASENYASIETKYKEAESFALELKSKLEITAHELMAVQEKLDQTVGDLAICQSDLEIKTEILHKLETEHNRVSAMLMEAEDLAKSDGVQKNTLCEELVLTRSMLDETKKKVDDLESQLRIQSEACNAAEMSLLATKASETAVTQRLSETNDSLTEIKKELTRVNSEKSTEHKSKIDLQQKNDSLTSEAVRLSEELQNLQLDEARLKEEMLEKSQHLNEFEQALKLKEQEIEHSTAQVEQLRSEISLLKDKCDVAVAEAEEKSQQAVQSENAFRDVETEKRTLEDKLASLAAQQGDSEKKSFDYLDKIQTLEKSLTQVSSDLKVKSEGYDKLYGNFTDITTQRNSLQVLIEGLQKDKMELNAQTGKLTADIKGTCEQLETSKKENEDLKKKLIESSDELNVLKQQNNIVKEALKEKENKLLEVQCELVELSKKFEEQNTTLKTTHDEVTQLMADLSEAANSKKNLTKDLEMQTASNEKITMELCRTKTDLDNLTADLLTNNTNFETMLAEKQKLVEQVNSSNAALQAEYNSLNNKFSTATIELQNIGEERSALQKKLNVIAEKCDALENNLSKVQYDNKEVTVTLEKANLEIENVQSKCNMLTKNLQESGIQLQSATNENEQLQIKLEEITISKNSLGELLKKTANSEGDLVTQCNKLTEKNLHTLNELHQAKALLDKKSIILSQLEAANKQMEMSLLETKSNLETEQVNFATVSKEKEKLEDKIVELSSKIDALSSQECDLQAKLIEMSKLLEESNINCSSMTNLNEQHKAEIKELSLKADKLSVERAQFEAECEKHLNSSCELHTSLTKAEQEKLHESERLQESVAKCIALDAINSQAKVEIEAMKQKIDQGLKEKEHLQTELLNSQSSNADLHATLKQIEKEKDDIGEELKQIVLKCTSLEEANNHFKVEMEAINSKLKTVIDEKDQLETDASLQIISFVELQTQCYSLEEKVTTLEMELKMSQGSADENITALRCETSDLKEKIEKLLAEKLAAEQCLAEEKSNIETLQLGLDKIKQENADQISKIESLEQLLNASEDCVSRLKDAELQHTGHKQSLAEELQSVKDKLSQIETENQLKSKQLSDLYAEKEKSMLEIETLQTSSTAKSSESEVKITELLKLNEQNNLEKSNIDSELQQFRLNYSKLQENYSSLESKAEQLNNSIDVLKQEKEMLQTEKNQLTELAEVLQAKVKKMEKSLPDIEEREAVLKKEFSQERESLQRSLDITTSLLEEKNKEMDASNREITYLKGEFVVQESVKERLKQAESEKDQLFEQVQHLKQQVKSGATTNGEGGAGDGGSADFLNAVIVNQQQKIAELTDKIKELEDLALNGDAELDDLDDEQRRQLPPRLFCDICDVFDAHDTEDCPTQSMEAEPDQGADTKYARGEQRPYCDDCEVFGHWTEECEEEQMY